jgi:hypothetical protein
MSTSSAAAGATAFASCLASFDIGSNLTQTTRTQGKQKPGNPKNQATDHKTRAKRNEQQTKTNSNKQPNDTNNA